MHFVARYLAGAGLALSFVLAHAQTSAAYSLHERPIEHINGDQDPGSLSADISFAPVIYFVNGINKRDGMTAMIDFARKFLIMSSDSFVLDGCGSLLPSRNCTSSRYFTFHHDPAITLSIGREWMYASVEVNVVRECVFNSPSGDVEGFDIESGQFYGTFNFYVSASEDLLGWRLNYGEGEDLYLRNGLRLGSCRPPPEEVADGTWLETGRFGQTGGSENPHAPPAMEHGWQVQVMQSLVFPGTDTLCR